MAVIKGISVSIQVNKQALQEYDDIDETDQNGTDPRDDGDSMPHLVSKYIEATSGARFAIRVVVPESAKEFTDALGVRFLLDGNYVEKNFMSMRLSKLGDGVWGHCKGGASKVTRAGVVKRPFMFREVKCSDDSSTSSRKEQERGSIDDLGTIVVKVWRHKISRPRSGRAKLTNFSGHLDDVEEQNEKEIKGKNLTHTVSFGKEEAVDKRTRRQWDSELVDGWDSPFAIFTFKYCSKKALQSLLLIPRTPSPTPVLPPVPLEERPEDELSFEELRELARRQRARFQVERKANVKPKPGIKAEFGIKSERGIKRDRDDEIEGLVPSSSAKQVKGPIANGEIVDLSD